MWSLGIGVWWSTAASLISSLLSKLKARSTYFENQVCTKDTLKDLDSEGLLEKASIITTPTAYSDGVLHSVKPEQTLGSELVINGDGSSTTDWNEAFGNTTLSINNNKLRATSNSLGAYGLSQGLILDTSKKYIITVDINVNNASGGTANLRLATNLSLTENFTTLSTTTGITTTTFTPTASTMYIGIVDTADISSNYVEINNISVKEVTNADFTFTRNNPGTRVNASGNIESIGVDLPRIDYRGFSYQDILGSELAVNGDFATDSDWALESGWGISNGKLVGTLSNATNAYQEKTLEAGKEYKITYEITNYTQGGVRFQFVGGSTINGLTRNSLGAYTEYLTATDNHNRIRFRSLTTDGGFTGSIDNVSVKEVIGQEVVPNSGCGSWLLEPEATNTAIDSNDFTTGSIFITSGNPGVDGGILTSAQATSPDGTNNAWKLVDSNDGSTGTVSLRFFGTNVTANNYNTVSLFVKKQGNNDWFYINVGGYDFPTNSAFFNISNGTVGNVGSDVTENIEDYGNGWYRISVTFQTTTDIVGAVQFRLATSNGPQTLLRDGTNGAYIYGLQAESHATRQYPTSYIPTSGGTGTRAADIATDAGSSDLINSSEGVLYFEAKANNSTTGSISINDSSATNRITARFRVDINKIQLSVVGSTNDFSFNSSLLTISDYNKIAIVYNSSGEYYFFVNGVKSNVQSKGTFTADTLTQLDFNRGGGNEPFQGNVKCVAVFKEALTDAELTALTS